MDQASFFEVADNYARLDKGGDPLAGLDAAVDWRGLARLMRGVVFDRDKNEGKGGRPPLCGLIMAKILILQACNNLADDRTEFLINDRLSFKRFLGLGVNDKSPDAKTIWLWRERVLHSGLHKKIFAWFEGELVRSGFEAKQGQIVDATFVPTHKPTGRQKKQLRDEIPLTAAQVRQTDNDATFTRKGKVTYHGYKNHTGVDAKWKLIRRQETTTASVHDSQKLKDLVTAPPAGASEEDTKLWADSAYRSAEAEAMLAEKTIASEVHERAYRNTPLTELQKAANRLKSSVRARIEHVYGHMKTAMGGLVIHTVGLARAEAKMTFKNLAYNMQRFVFLMSRKRQEPCI
ncbi:MAG: IS5 family transposase [Alphaproteobacteria bacterium]|nr:IS5 family transposase [Alphaproteobacteria bacterium]